MALTSEKFRPDAARGAVLIVALLVAALIAVMLGSYLNLNLASSRLAKRSFNGYAALNLAEAGTEEAVWSFNRVAAGDATAWNAWTNNGASAWQTFAVADLGQNTAGSMKVFVDGFRPSANSRPKVVSQSSVGAPGEVPVMKIVEVTLRRRAFFANGLVAKDSIAFHGTNATVDSWNSDPDGNAATAPVAYDASIRTDHGSVASTSVLNTAVMVNQVNVWGTVATGGAQPQVGNQGTIRGADTAADVAVDPRRISTDFNADFPGVGVPGDGVPIPTIGAGTLGVANTVTKWRSLGLVLSGNEILTILGDVTLVLTAGSGTQAVSVTGNGAIVVPAGSKLTLYSEGDVRVGGKGLANANAQPISCRIWGTNQSTAGQAVDIVGNGALKTVVYAPNGDVSINGNGDVMGAIVARSITMVGNASFHYDESLANFESNEPFSISKWREVTSGADYTRYVTLFQGF